MVECHSVDGFQGREKAVIVFSAVRSNSSGRLGFCVDWCRTNVALTRARNGLIVVGNEATLRSDTRSWAPWIKWAWAEGIVVGAEGARGTYDEDYTRSLATGEKAFADRQLRNVQASTGHSDGAGMRVGMGGGGHAAAGPARPPVQVGGLLLSCLNTNCH